MSLVSFVARSPVPDAFTLADTARAVLPTLVASSADPLVILTPGGTIVAASPRARRWMDRRPGLEAALSCAARASSRTRGLRLPEHGAHAQLTRCDEGADSGWVAVLTELHDEADATLSRRQLELLDLLELGLSNAAIAESMALSPTTVKTMLQRLYRRTGATNRVALVRWARAER